MVEARVMFSKLEQLLCSLINYFANNNISNDDNEIMINRQIEEDLQLPTVALPSKSMTILFVVRIYR